MNESAVVPDSLPASLATLPRLIQRYLSGERIRDLAPEFPACRQTLYNWMHSYAADTAYPDLVRQAIVNRIASADDELENADNLMDLARARELAKFTRWDAERRLPKLFGPKQEISQDNRITVIVQRDRAPVNKSLVENQDGKTLDCRATTEE